MKIKSVISMLLTVLMIMSIATVALVPVSAEEVSDSLAETGATIDEVKNPYQKAAQDLDKEYAYSGELGALYSPESTTFKLWAPTSSRVEVNLYAKGSKAELGPGEDDKLGAYELSKLMDGEKWTGVWTVTIEGDFKDVYYTYTATNNALVTGKEKTSEFVDPYAKAVGVNGNRGMIVDLDSTDPEGWENDAHIYVDEQTDAVVWEVVVKDFSANENSGISEANRGKYLAFTEKGTTLNDEGYVSTGIDYLKQLGITHVQINPFYDFGSVDESGSNTQFNWGYDPKNYNVPEGYYSSNPYDGNIRIKECKQMIQALHEAGIGVIMDVVYNHTYDNDNSNFQLAVPNYYYRKNASGGWSNASGCGNDTASERAMFRKFMIDSCRYWAEEYHVDGFRFDLMGIHDAETMNLIREDLDKIDTRTIMYGEGWNASSSVFDTTTCAGTKTLSCYQQNAEFISDRVAMFNDQIRDALKGNVFSNTGTGFLQGSKSCYNGIAFGIRANTVGRGSNWHPVAPSQCVTYAACHDNHTLYDRLVASVYGEDSDYRQRYSDLIAMNKLSAAIVGTSQGICFYHAGEEMARSKDGDHNSYKSSVTVNQIDWSLAASNADLVSYYRGIIDIRKAFSPFTAGDDTFKTSYTLNGSLASVDDTLGFTIDNSTEGEWDKIAVIYNSNPFESFDITMLDDSVSEWVVIADETCAGLDALYEVKGNTFTVAPSSCIIAVDKASYEAVGLKSGDGKLTVKHVNEKTGEILSSQVITGEIDTGYETAVDSSLGLVYDLSRVDGDAKGKFTKNDATVTYYYKPYVAPSLLDGDVDGDGKVNIKDATYIQKSLAKILTLTEEQKKKADYDYSNSVNVKDVTMLQKHLVDMDVSIATVTTNFLTVKDDGTEATLSAPIVKKYRVGEEYKTTPIAIELYAVDETKLPDNAEGIVPAGTTNVDFYYLYSASGYKIHAIHLDETQTWTPYIWAWAGSTNAFSNWPGVAMLPEGDGWYSIDAALPEGIEYSIIISNNGSPQSADYTGNTASEIWIVINDAGVVNKGKFLTVYEEKPDMEALRAEIAG
ncbi:MAG: type I pullulanase [Eubacteriales bacterium]|nr:type I pullulanase [Eubacteriales bacterium]